MTTPAEYNLLLVKGDKYELPVQYADETEDPVDITGLDVTWTFTFNDVDLVLTDGDGLTVTPATGDIELLLTSAQTEAFVGRTGTHRLRLIDGSDEPFTLMWGRVTIKTGPCNG